MASFPFLVTSLLKLQSHEVCTFKLLREEPRQSVHTLDCTRTFPEALTFSESPHVTGTTGRSHLNLTTTARSKLHASRRPALSLLSLSFQHQECDQDIKGIQLIAIERMNGTILKEGILSPFLERKQKLKGIM